MISNILSFGYFIFKSKQFYKIVKNKVNSWKCFNVRSIYVNFLEIKSTFINQNQKKRCIVTIKIIIALFVLSQSNKRIIHNANGPA